MRVFILAAIVAVSGCASTPQGERLERIGIQALVMNQVIEKAPHREAKALEILASVNEMRTLMDFNSISVMDLRAAMLRRISTRDLAPSERLVALEFVEEIAALVETKVGAGDLLPEHKVTVNKVLGYVESAARMYVP